MTDSNEKPGPSSDSSPEKKKKCNRGKDSVYHARNRSMGHFGTYTREPGEKRMNGTMRSKGGRPIVIKPNEYAFADIFMRNGNNKVDAVRRAFPETKGRSATVQKRRADFILGKPHVREYIMDLESKVVSQAGPSLDKLVEIRDTSDDMKLVLKASESILNSYERMLQRHQKEEEAESRNVTNNFTFMQLSDEELMRRINDIKEKLDLNERRKTIDAEYSTYQAGTAEPQPGAGEEDVQEVPDVHDGERP